MLNTSLGLAAPGQVYLVGGECALHVVCPHACHGDSSGLVVISREIAHIVISIILPLIYALALIESLVQRQRVRSASDKSVEVESRIACSGKVCGVNQEVGQALFARSGYVVYDIARYL